MKEDLGTRVAAIDHVVAESTDNGASGTKHRPRLTQLLARCLQIRRMSPFLDTSLNSIEFRALSHITPCSAAIQSGTFCVSKTSATLNCSLELFVGPFIILSNGIFIFSLFKCFRTTFQYFTCMLSYTLRFKDNISFRVF